MVKHINDIRWLLLRIEDGLSNSLVNLKDADGNFIGNTWIGIDYNLIASNPPNDTGLNDNYIPNGTRVGMGVFGLSQELFDVLPYSGNISLNVRPFFWSMLTAGNISPPENMSIGDTNYYDQYNPMRDAQIGCDIDSAQETSKTFYGEHSNYQSGNAEWKNPHGLFVGDIGSDSRRVVGAGDHIKYFLLPLHLELDHLLQYIQILMQYQKTLTLSLHFL